MVGTLINVGTVLAGTAIGTAVGPRLPERMQQRVLAGLGMVTLAIGIDLALAWGRQDTTTETPLYVLGGILLGGLVGEAIGIERRLEGLGDRSRPGSPARTSTARSPRASSPPRCCSASARSPSWARSRTG